MIAYGLVKIQTVILIGSSLNHTACGNGLFLEFVDQYFPSILNDIV